MNSARERLQADNAGAPGANVERAVREMRGGHGQGYNFGRWDVKREAVTPGLIAYMRRWLLSRYGLESMFVLLPGEGRNRATLRLVSDGCTYEGEVSVLNAFRRQFPEAAKDRLFAVLVECVG